MPRRKALFATLGATDDFACRQIVEALSEGVYVTHLERRIVYWNTGAERISGFAASMSAVTR